MIRRIFLLCALAAPLSAQDGEQLYTLYCAACHAPDGKGATGGVFPPLAGSSWITGDGKRPVSIVLKGLHGPVEVNGKGFNLDMPPQEAVLADDIVAAILTHVRSSWGNKEAAISTDQVKAVRAEFASRTMPWTAPEILKLYPLPKKETALKNLISRVYKGQWKKLPDFEKLQPEGVEEEHDGIISLGISRVEGSFGIVWEGDLIAAKNGPHEFFLDADDGARVIINGEAVATVDGMGPMGLSAKRSKKGKAELKRGPNPIRIEYFDSGSNKGLTIGWRHRSVKDWTWLTEDSGEVKPEWPDIILKPADSKTVIYRNFIDGTTARAIGFGFPGGVNLAYSADHLAPELVWKGDFINAGHHWTGRGQGNEPPHSKDVAKLTSERFLPADARFKGYSVDADGNPTFIVTVGAQTLRDSWKPGETGTLLRTLELSGDAGNLEIPLGNAAITGSEKVALAPGKPVTVTYTLK